MKKILLLVFVLISYKYTIGQTPNATLSISPFLLSFPTTAVGDTSGPLSITVSGTGFMPIEIVIMELIGDAGTGFMDFQFLCASAPYYSPIYTFHPDASGNIPSTNIDIYFMPDQIGTSGYSIIATGTGSAVNVGVCMETGISTASTTVINSVSLKQPFLLYPNPCTDGIIQLEKQTNEVVESIIITNVSGVLKQSFLGFQPSFDLKNLETGLYFIYIKSNLGTHIQKITIL